MITPTLSIVIPTLNEALTITALIANLVEQKKPPLYEIIIVDGGSQDETLDRINKIAAECAELVRVVVTKPGRARQMNEGVKSARGQSLLFLHADTVITDPLLLYHANLDMRSAYESRGNERVAGHFGLYFIRAQSGGELAYYFYECKTRLNRPGCINGDQGIWLSRDFFNALGGFDESLGFMEDARLASLIFKHGQWITLSSCVFTSARRFESEGLKERQTLNALLCAMDVIRMEGFFNQAHLAYQAQANARYLELKPFLTVIHQASWAKGLRQGLVWWWRTGGYVISNAWQLVFAMDCRDNFKKGVAVSDTQMPRLRRYDRYFKPIVESVVGQVLAAGATFVWFYAKLLFQRS